MKSLSAPSPKTLGRLSKLYLSFNIIKLDELSIKYFSLFLKNIATGFVSKIFIIIVSGYFLLTSIFSKKSISFRGFSISISFRKKIFFLYILLNFSSISLSFIKKLFSIFIFCILNSSLFFFEISWNSCGLNVDKKIKSINNKVIL